MIQLINRYNRLGQTVVVVSGEQARMAILGEGSRIIECSCGCSDSPRR